jgi:hypothetical protein
VSHGSPVRHSIVHRFENLGETGSCVARRKISRSLELQNKSRLLVDRDTYQHIFKPLEVHQSRGLWVKGVLALKFLKPGVNPSRPLMGTQEPWIFTLWESDIHKFGRQRAL